MRFSPRWTLAAAMLSLFVLAACARSPMHRDASRPAAVNCPAGTTLTCEANTVGRIRHGSFSRNNDKCACVQDDGRSLNSPVIPSIH